MVSDGESGRCRSGSNVSCATSDDGDDSANESSGSTKSQGSAGSRLDTLPTSDDEDDHTFPSGVRFTAVFPDFSNTAEARVATLPQVSTIIVVLSIVVWLCFKHYLAAIELVFVFFLPREQNVVKEWTDSNRTRYLLCLNCSLKF